MVGVIAMVDIGDLQLRLIDGRFDGGLFRGLTLSVVDSIDPENEDRQIDIYPSGLIQNFIFKDNNVAEASKFKYNSSCLLRRRESQAVITTNNIYPVKFGN